METFSALLALCAGISPITVEFPSHDMRLNKRLNKQSCGWWFETPSCSLWRHCNAYWREKKRIIFSHWKVFINNSYYKHDFFSTTNKLAEKVTCIWEKIIINWFNGNFQRMEIGMVQIGGSDLGYVPYHPYWKRQPGVKTLRPRQMDAILQTTFSNGFSWTKMFEFRLKVHWSLFPGVQWTIFQYWFR